MANESSLGGTQFVFDLDSQTGVMQLLAAVRASDISHSEKNELRDLVFTYANGGKDQSIKIIIEQKVAAHGIVPVVSPVAEQVEEVPKVSSIGGSRPAPSFAVSKPAQPAPAPTPTPAPAPAPQPAPQAAPEPIPEPPAPAPAPQPAPQAAPEPIPEPPAPAAPQPAPQPMPAPAAPVNTSYDPDQSLRRIREIKMLVNEKVGNPVNLVDIDNEVGREYMGALLDAMKKLNSGTSASSAMQRLETAFAAVEKTIEEHKDEIGKKPTPTPTPQPAPEPVPEPPKPEPMPEPPAPEPIPEPEPMPEPPAPAPVPEPAPAPEPVPEPPKPEPPAPVPIQKLEPIGAQSSDAPANLPVAQVPLAAAAPAGKAAPKRNEMPVTGVEPSWGPATDTVLPKKVESTPNQPGGKVASLAESDTKLRTPDELPLASSLETSSVAGDPLFTKEVDDGLQQLLSEWPLFKKSGLFGTGPKGREHPLFKKVAGLQIPLLLAGRFEGATQEIKQSITDYMNGWRYEQGIIYHQGETFEHYLRRVIRHIIDLQKAKK